MSASFTSPRSSVSQSFAHLDYSASSVRSVTITPSYCAYVVGVTLLAANASAFDLPLERERSTIEVMYLSFRRSKDALLALGFFVLMVVVVFSTLLYVLPLPSPCFPDSY